MGAREKGSLQRGMYFKEPPAVSVVLMSRRRGAPYEDELSDDGTELVYEGHDVRKVFKFRMRLSDRPDQVAQREQLDDFRRVIPAWVKQAVYKRDKGRCVVCGAEDQLHFDHDLPYSKGGTGLTPHNVRILCARHNLQKGARIE